MNSARRLRVLVATLWVAIAVLVLRSIAAPPARLTKEQAIAQVEQLGGKVRIDGEAPGEPVWMVDFTGVTVDAAALRLLNAFPTLETLHLDRTAIGDDLLPKIGDLRTLKDLSLAETRVTDAGLKHLTRLEQLAQLNLSGTRITNEGLQQLASLQKLTRILYAESRITPLGIDLFADAQERSRPPAAGAVSPVESRPENAPEPDIPPVLAVRSELGDTLHALGRSLFPAAHGDPERRQQAVSLLEQAYLAHPQSEQIQLDLADAYVQLSTEETLTLALGLYEEVLARHPGGNEALLARIADAYGRLGNFDAAIAVAAARLRTPTASPFPAALQIADFAAQSSDLERGIAELTGIVRGYPLDPGIKLLLAALLIEIGQPAEATPHLDAAVQLLPADSPLAQVARGLQERTR